MEATLWWKNIIGRGYAVAVRVRVTITIGVRFRVTVTLMIKVRVRVSFRVIGIQGWVRVSLLTPTHASLIMRTWGGQNFGSVRICVY